MDAVRIHLLALSALGASVLCGCATQLPFGKIADLASRPAIQPKVVPADDPVRLSSEPVTAGADLHFHAARVLESQNNIPAAIAQYQKALALKPSDVRTLVSFARLYDRQGDFAQAQALYRRALEIEPNNATALNDLGMCDARQGATEAAIEVLSRAIQLQPENMRYRNNLAAVLVQAGRPDEAFSHLAAVHSKAAAHYNLGYLLARLGKTELAMRHLAWALESDPHLEPARQMLNKLDGLRRPRVDQIPVGYPSQGDSSPIPPVPPPSRLPQPGLRPLPPVDNGR